MVALTALDLYGSRTDHSRRHGEKLALGFSGPIFVRLRSFSRLIETMSSVALRLRTVLDVGNVGRRDNVVEIVVCYLVRPSKMLQRRKIDHLIPNTRILLLWSASQTL